jgi:glycosyltransferase involved in cell wall biosynthesis
MGTVQGPVGRHAANRRRRPRSVGVLIDLELTENAGGHVKCWQRLAEASVGLRDGVDLTVYFLGHDERVIPLGENVRYVTLTPRLGTRRFRFLAQGAGHTDLASHHPRLAAWLAGHDVIHTTDVFAFGQTGRRAARRQGIPLVTSIHTDLPLFTEIYTAEIVRRIFGDGALTRFVLDDLEAGKRSARGMQRKVDEMIRQSDHVIVSNREDQCHAASIVGSPRVSFLRRGIDRERFNPDRRDRDRLAATFGIPSNCPVLLFVGRIDATKKALFAAERARTLIDAGHDLRFLAIGAGAQQAPIAALLGPYAVMPGSVPQEDLGWIYPSADIFVFPSESESYGNVVIEAKAAGLPVLVADHPGPSQLIRQPGADGFVLPTSDPASWHRVLTKLLSDPAERQAVGFAAHRAVAAAWPSWRDVVEQDLLPVWRKVMPRSVASTNTAAGFALSDPSPSQMPAE